MEWLPTLLGYLVISATLIGAIAASCSAVAFVFERRDSLRDKSICELCRTEIALAIQIDADMFEKHPTAKKLLKDIAFEVIRKKQGGVISLDAAFDEYAKMSAVQTERKQGE